MLEPSAIDDAQTVERMFASWLGPEAVSIVLSPPNAIEAPSFELRAREILFLGISRSRADTAVVAAALEKFERAHLLPGQRPLLVVPYMGEVGDRLCREAGVAWLDLSGNAHIRGVDLFIHVEGKPNKFRSVGRPSNAFAAKSSRITRFLLENHDHAFSQSEIADATGLGAGYTSKIVRRLEDLQLLTRNDADQVRVRDPDLLLEAWREKYEFSMHSIVKGTVAARSSEELAFHLQAGLREFEGQFAATGLAAAWAMTKFANHRIVTFFVEQVPDSALKSTLGFRSGEKGANVWLVTPKDRGVFQGKEDVDGLMCVHPVQAYLDVLAHPERGQEAAHELRSSLLNWRA